MNKKNTNYVLRGQRVEKLDPGIIKCIALNTMTALKINRSTLRNMDIFCDNLWHKHSINIEVHSNEDWINIADAWCEPEKFTISIPHKLYERILYGKDIQALHIIFHELGHLLLGHKPVLHYSDKPPTQEEDSEWQADLFADTILEKLGKTEYKQLSLF